MLRTITIYASHFQARSVNSLGRNNAVAAVGCGNTPSSSPSVTRASRLLTPRRPNATASFRLGELTLILSLLAGPAAGLSAGDAVGIATNVAPQVLRVEPPSWWSGHSHNPVRLLLTGQHLGAARVTAPTGFSVANLKASADGRYLFADLDIPANRAPGPITLQAVNSAGQTDFNFELLAPLAPAQNFRGFTADDVIYLAMIDRFANGDRANDDPPISPGLHDRARARYYHGGDLQGVQDRLDYLRELGVTAVWLTPWYDNVNHLNRQEKYTRENKLSAHGEPITDYHGYGAVDFYATEERFGDLRQLRELVAQSHRRGLKVIQDQVANHTGPYHPWVTRPPTPTWFNGSAANHLANSWQTWTVAASNPPPDQFQSTLEGWFINLLPDLNQTDPETATYLIQNSLWWAGVTGVDAIRQDTLPYVPRTYWSQWTTAVKRAHPNLTILGEMWDGDPKLVAFFQGGQTRFDGVDSGVDTLFDFPLYNAMREVFLQGRPMTRLTETLAADTNYVNASRLVTFLGLHDTTRFRNEPGATAETMKLAFTFLLTTRGTPLIYYGDEIALRGGSDPDNRRDFPGGWPEDAANAFEPSGRTPEQAAMYDHVQRLLAVRRTVSPLRRGVLLNLSVGRDTYAFARVTPEGFAVVALNNSEQPRHFDLDATALPPGAERIVSDRLGTLGTLPIADGRLNITLPAKSAAVFTPGAAAKVEALAQESSHQVSPQRPPPRPLPSAPNIPSSVLPTGDN